MRTVVVIGATSDIASEVCRRMAVRGDRLVLLARNPSYLAALAEDLQARGASQVETYAVDALDYAQHEGLLRGIQERAGIIDLVLIAHGSLDDQKACERDFAAARHSLEVNFLSVVSFLTHAANIAEEQGQGHLAVITSVAGDRGRQSNYVYGAGRGGVSIFLQGLRNRLASKGITVTSFKLGFVDTRMTAHVPKNALFATPERVSLDIMKALDKRRDVAYVPWFWLVIMTIIKVIPERIFKRLKL